MIAYVKTDDEGRVIASTTDEQFAAGMQQVTVDDGFNFLKQQDYTLQDGALVYDGKHTQEQEQAAAEAEEKAAAAEREERAKTQAVSGARMMVATLDMSAYTETQIAEVNALLPDWVPEGHSYKQGDAFQWDNGRTWRASQALTSQSIYPPDSSEALYYEIVIAPDGIIVYRPAKGQYDAVRLGEKRHYPDAEGAVYESLIDYNAYSPDDYPQGWKLVED